METIQGGRLRAAQAPRIRSLIVDKLPDQLQLPFHLWMRAAVVSLIAREYDSIAHRQDLRAGGIAIDLVCCTMSRPDPVRP